MASLNLSSNGPSISKSYQAIIDSPPPTGASASSPTYGQWVVYTVSTPLVNAFQPDAPGKESVLRVHSTGDGELLDLIEEFSEGKIQFAFVKVKDPNTGLPKYVLIAWCGEGVPERTKGYFTSHLAAVSKFLHGYHVQVTARSDADLTPESIIQKVADASGAKYASGPAVSAPLSANRPPPPGSKPVFTPSRSSGLTRPTPGGATRLSSTNTGPVDDDGWGLDAPPVTRTELEKVPSAYQPTKVNIQQLTAQRSNEPAAPVSRQPDNTPSDVVKGAYQPIGKVDIAAIRRQAKEAGEKSDERPVPVKGAYEPVGKVDIAAIKARAQRPSDNDGEAPVSAPSRDFAGSNAPAPSLPVSGGSERLTSLPKPKVANKFGGGGSFAGTKAPLPGGFAASTPSAAAPVGIASRTFADEGGKTPAQLWAERKAKERQTGSSPQERGYQRPPEARAVYGGKAEVSNVTREAEETDVAPGAGSVSSIRDRFAQDPAITASVLASNQGATALSGRGLPEQDVSQDASFAEDQYEEVSRQNVPTPPPQPRSPTPPTPAERESSPIRIAMPVSGGHSEPVVQDAHEEQHSPPQALPIRSLEEALPQEEELEDSGHDAARAAAQTAATDLPSSTASIQAVVQYDYEKAEDNEIELREGEFVTDIEMVDEDWWSGVNAQGERGLFPSNYVEVVEAGSGHQEGHPTGAGHETGHYEVEKPYAAAETHEAEDSHVESSGATATALYDYEAAEDNELSFPDGAKITNVEFPDEDWWSGEYGGKAGLFPANYVQLDQ